jgi:hypothetical protein
MRMSRRQALPTARAAGGDYLATAHGRHAGTKAMPTLAHELAGLKSPFHGLSPVTLPIPALARRPRAKGCASNLAAIESAALSEEHCL